MTMRTYQDQQRNRQPFVNPQGEAMLQLVQAHWQAMRPDCELPLREDISPAELDVALPHCFIAQGVAPGVARIRVAGQALCDLIGLDLRAMPLGTLFTGDTRPIVQDMTIAALQGAAIAIADFQTQATLLRPKVQAQMMLLPLRDRADGQHRMLGILVSTAATLPSGQRFSRAAQGQLLVQPLPVKSRHLRLADDMTDAPGPAPVSILPNPPPRLRLVVNNT